LLAFNADIGVYDKYAIQWEYQAYIEYNLAEEEKSNFR